MTRHTKTETGATTGGATVDPASAADSRRLATELRHAILEGIFAPNQPFPSIRELSRRHQTGLRVARTATDILVKEGLLLRRERSGTFVRMPLAARPESGARLHCVTVLERPAGTHPGFVRVDYLQGYTQALDAYPIKLRVMRLPATADDIASALSEHYALPEQGCILVNIVDATLFRWLTDHRVPFVVQNYTQYPKASLPPHHSVTVNKVGGAFKATQHLIGLGHRRIGYAESEGDDVGATAEIHEGYSAAMRCSGLESRPEDVLSLSADPAAAARELARRCLGRRDGLTAIVARTDATAIRILHAARTLGLEVPRDVSVTGFNNQAEAELSDPPLTTVAVPRLQLGRTAIDVLLGLGDGALEAPVSKVIECHLVERASAGPRNRVRAGRG